MNLVDGRETSVIPVEDRGLAYGDGVFETLRARHGRLPLLDYHLARLFDGLRALAIGGVAQETLVAELKAAANACHDGIVKLTVTRGDGRGYQAPHDTRPRRIIATHPLAAHVNEWRSAGVTLRACETPLEGPRALAGLKHLNRLPQVLARAEWNDPGIHEGLMRDLAGRVIEGTMSNVFFAHGDVLTTPPVGAGVSGVMRRFVLERAAAIGIPLRETFLDDAQIRAADEAFITNSVIGVCPVRRIGDRAYRIGTMSRLLQADVENELERRACSDA